MRTVLKTLIVLAVFGLFGAACTMAAVAVLAGLWWLAILSTLLAWALLDLGSVVIAAGWRSTQRAWSGRAW